LCCFGGMLNAQNAVTDDGRIHTTTTTQTQTQTTARYEQPTHVLSYLCDSVATTQAAGNGNDGAMFDVVAVQNARITFLDVALTPGSIGTIKVYYRMGTHVGHETNSASWIFIDSTRMADAPGLDHIPIFINKTVTAGNTISFYVTGNVDGLAVDYTNGTTLSAVYNQDAFIRVLEGTGVSYPFAATFAPRVFNGSVIYCDAAPTIACDSLLTSMSSNNGNDGNMFEVEIGPSDVSLQRLHCNVNGSGWWHIYYRQGNYAGHETTPSDWILIDSAQVISLGADVPTPIMIDLNLYATAGSVISFYVTGNGTGADINYIDGTQEGANYSADGAMAIRQGKGVTWPFAGNFSPRIWSGYIDYCIGITGVEESIGTTWNAEVLPNPASSQAELVIAAPNTIDNAQVRILDINGREVAAINGVNNNRVALPVDQLSAGVYFYLVMSENGQVLTKGKFVRQ
ncbi:MAG: T9SS type A sorting domain-containing protein, partial [Bacteroidia bacterium]